MALVAGSDTVNFSTKLASDPHDLMLSINDFAIIFQYIKPF